MISQVRNLFDISPTSVKEIKLIKTINGEPLFVIVLESGITDFHFVIKKVLTTAFNIYLVNEMLRSLNTGIDIKFECFKQYNDLLIQISKKLEIPY